MKNSSLFRSFALVAALGLAVPLLAKPFSKNINLAQTAKLGKAELQAGEYRLLIDGNKATVEKGGKTVAESEGRWEDRSAKSSYDSLLINVCFVGMRGRLPPAAPSLLIRQIC